MTTLFTLYLQAGLWGSLIILLILPLRLLLNKAPRHLVCVLWLLAGLRFLLPFQLESPMSLQPDTSAITEVIVQPSDQFSPAPDGQIVQDKPDPGTNAISTTETEVLILSYAWLGVGSAALVYAAVSYWVLRYKVRCAVRTQPDIRESPSIPGAFLLGYFRPTIYIPTDMATEERHFVLAHERAHIARGDHWWKLLGYICCCIHWYNPLIWIAFTLMGRDIEIACDERVIQNLPVSERKAYSMVLLQSVKRIASLNAYPVAFVEGSLKQRIRKILTFKKPGLLICTVGITAAVIVTVCFLTTPKADDSPSAVLPTQSTTAPSEGSEATQDTASAPTQDTLPPATAAPTEESTDPTPVATEEPSSIPTEAPTEAPTEPPTSPTTAPTTPPSTEPPATSPPQATEPAETTPENRIPDGVQTGDRTPAADTADHTHTYSVSTTAPTCVGAGYDTYTCTCGHTYYDNFVDALGHDWQFKRHTEASVNYGGGDLYNCTRCIEIKYENYVPAKYKSYDLDAIDAKTTAYAADKGFQTMDSHPNTSVKCFRFQQSATGVELQGGQGHLLRNAKNLVDQAAAYCKENGYTKSNCMVWVNVTYNKSSLDFIVEVYCAA